MAEMVAGMRMARRTARRARRIRTGDLALAVDHPAEERYWCEALLSLARETEAAEWGHAVEAQKPRDATGLEETGAKRAAVLAEWPQRRPR